MCLFNCKSRTVSPPDFYSLAGDRPKQGNSTPAATIPDNSTQGNPTAAAAIPDTPTQGNPTPEKKRPASQSNSHGESDKKSTDEAVQKPENGARVSGHKVQGKYSIKFKIVDQTGKICNGMYYSVKVIGTKELYNSGTTDANGETEIFYSDIADKAYLYIGHRTEKFEDLPTSRSTPEQISDECNLNNGGDQQITMTPHEENKPPITVQTQRLWKPWNYSEKYKSFLIEVEKLVPYFKDLEKKGIGNTVGYGHYESIFQKDKKTRNPAFDYFMKLYPDSKHKIPDDAAKELLEKDIPTRGSLNKYNSQISGIPVPLYQREIDAIIDLSFNGGSLAFTYKSGLSNLCGHENVEGFSIETLLKHGRYTMAGETILSRANTISSQWSKGVQRRRNAESGIFNGGSYHWKDYKVLDDEKDTCK